MATPAAALHDPVSFIKCTVKSRHSQLQWWILMVLFCKTKSSRLGFFSMILHWLPRDHYRIHMKSPCAEVLDMALSKMDPKKKQGYIDQLKKSTTCSAPLPARVAIRTTTEVAKVEQEILLHKLESCSKMCTPMTCVIATYSILLPLIFGLIGKRIPPYRVIPWFNPSYRVILRVILPQNLPHLPQWQLQL